MQGECTRALLQAAMVVAPTGKEQQGFAKIVRAMEGAGEDDGQIALNLAQALVDGLKLGHWPS